MRFVFYAILIYMAYLGLRSILKKFANPGGKRTSAASENPAKSRRSKINLDEIEDAEYEEIKKP